MSDIDYSKELRSYLTGFTLAIALTVLAFAMVVWSPMTWATTVIVIGVLGLAQIVVQLRYFLHIDFNRQNREDLMLILFSTTLLVIMAVGTIWIMGNLSTRMH